ncbi:Hypothetical protein NTJ_10048 [Nesidiocoris tenuis]|uniref:Uncharacterized protein n=1 Tax=Nesidiocoris tenuis TaxID=355587 RepID=A0ABN7B0B3_9HEMI|nr:Hypothetical protein NTJ_10048 [Nesidiocoris tenuis]
MQFSDSVTINRGFITGIEPPKEPGEGNAVAKIQSPPNNDEEWLSLRLPLTRYQGTWESEKWRSMTERTAD